MMFKYMDSPVGSLTLVTDSKKLVGLYFGKKTKAFLRQEYAGADFEKSEHPLLAKAEKELQEYFSGKRIKFETPLAVSGTDFQKKAWTALTKIPYGKTWSYSDQAKKMGKEKAVRAVGSANGKNKISIMIPCHRVIAKDGGLAGFGGGLSKKKWLLNLESSI